MPRLRHVESGSVVSCDEETAVRLGSEWVPTDDEKPARRGKRAAAKPSDDES